MTLKEEFFKFHVAKDGTACPDPMPDMKAQPTTGWDNGPLWAALGLYLLGARDDDVIKAARRITAALKYKPGIYLPNAGRMRHLSHDNVMAFVALLNLIGRDEVRKFRDEVRANDWCVNVHNPGKFTLRTWVKPWDQAYMNLLADGDCSLLQSALFNLKYSFYRWFKIDRLDNGIKISEAWNSWLKLMSLERSLQRGNTGKRIWDGYFTLSYWLKGINQRYPDGMNIVFSHFAKVNPKSTWFSRAFTAIDEARPPYTS